MATSRSAVNRAEAWAVQLKDHNMHVESREEKLFSIALTLLLA